MSVENFTRYPIPEIGYSEVVESATSDITLTVQIARTRARHVAKKAETMYIVDKE